MCGCVKQAPTKQTMTPSRGSPIMNSVIDVSTTEDAVYNRPYIPFKKTTMETVT